MIVLIVFALIAVATSISLYAVKTGIFSAPPPPTGIPDPIVPGEPFTVQGYDVPLHNQRLKIKVVDDPPSIFFLSKESNDCQWTITIPESLRGRVLRFSVSNACPVSSLEVFSKPVERRVSK